MRTSAYTKLAIVALPAVLGGLLVLAGPELGRPVYGDHGPEESHDAALSAHGEASHSDVFSEHGEASHIDIYSAHGGSYGVARSRPNSAPDGHTNTLPDGDAHTPPDDD